MKATIRPTIELLVGAPFLVLVGKRQKHPYFKYGLFALALLTGHEALQALRKPR